ncbi:nucleotidyltransferase family protein [Georgenia satyanarayanai]|uniref:nucleotidyltransferase family protein n=1 Tax=Georgenia satyanarayanai TaxID=860221 RepID=UPI002040058E|nr:nucleotidyltransferase family protein [Georgenia satyanarayanai]MCM3660615.1 nucleotidyltransferase family protein [Georgenia satyanarayanai]
MRHAGLVLAAGSGSRFGRPKAEVGYDGRTLLDRAVDACRSAELRPVVVVLGARIAPRVRLALPAHVDTVTNTQWRTGMASSLRTGLLHLTDETDADAAVVTLVDTPSVGAEHLLRVRRVLDAARPAAVASYGGAWRTPVALGRGLWPSVVASVSGDRGAGPWLRSHPELVIPVECGDLGPWTDIDTPEDLPR